MKKQHSIRLIEYSSTNKSVIEPLNDGEKREKTFNRDSAREAYQFITRIHTINPSLHETSTLAAHMTMKVKRY